LEISLCLAVVDFQGGLVMLRAGFFVAALALLPCVFAVGDSQTLKVMAAYQPNVDKGLQWLVKQQARDGHWEGLQGSYPIPLTAIAGMALLAEGSTPHQGKYAKEIDNAVEYLLSRTQPNGLIGDMRDPREQNQYMYGQGFATLFLAQAYGEETDERYRQHLERVLKRACDFIAKSQTKLGGWYYTSALDGNENDEGSTTITQVQALRAARNACTCVGRGRCDIQSPPRHS
jgi:squalene cyclase